MPQTVQQLIGYRKRVWANFVVALSTVLTVGLIWVAAHLFPSIRLLPLQKCAFHEAQFVLAKLPNTRQVLTKVVQITVSSAKPRGQIPATETINIFKLLLATYVYDAALGRFLLLPDLPSGLPSQLCLVKQALEAIEQGAEWNVLNPANTWPRRARSLLYGCNDMSAGRPNMFGLAAEGLMHPMYVVQYAELAFTVYDQYYYYALALLAVTLISGFTSTRVQYLKRLQLYSSVARHHVVPVVQSGRVRGVSSHRLVPGDVVVVLRGKATCDMVLLQGTCLVEESILSGEAAQVRKVSFVPPPDGESVTSDTYNPDTHQSCTIHAGTYVQQVWNEKASEEEVLALVARTSFCTTMGTMLRQVMAPLQTRDPFVRDLYTFCSFVLVLQLGIFMLYASRAAAYPVSAAAVIKRVVDTLIAAVPTGIPTIVIFSLWRCVTALKGGDVDVHRASAVKTAAAVEVVVFDKTGTLTGNLPGLEGMLPISQGKFAGLQRSAVKWPNSVKQCAAICNSLNLVNKKKVVGDEADLAAFKACEARFLDRNLVALPLKLARQKSARVTTLTLLRRFEFEANLLRSGAIAKDSAARPDEALFFVRGAPQSIKQLCDSTSIPSDYHQVIDDFSGRSFRLLALAKGLLRGVSQEALTHMTQEQLEQHVDSFELLGLLVLSNHLRSDSRDTITQLQQQAGLRTLMATGDYHTTALSVARGVGMVPPQGQVIVIQKEQDAKPAYQSSGLKATDKDSTQNTQQVFRAPSVAAKPLAFKPGTERANQLGNHSVSGTRSVSFAINQEQQEQTSQQRLLSVTDTCQQRPDQPLPADEHMLDTASSFTRQQHRQSSEHQGLVFHADYGSACERDAMQALTAIAQGEAQCCVTGAAFEHMLQLGDLSLLEAVMRNVVVFSRMKSHQKGQVMDLLGTRGLYQTIDGQRQHLPGLGKMCLYCGDGINDLIALAHADVGVSVGGSDAAAAAVFSTKRCSIAGLVLLLRECRAAQATKLAGIRFMCLYQLVLAVTYNVAFFMDGSSLSMRQRGVLDFMALSVGIACSLRPARNRLTARPSEQSLCMAKHFAMLSIVVLMLSSVYAFFMWYLTIQPWYTGGNSSSEQNAVITACWTTALCQVYGAPAMTFQADTLEWCKPFSLLELVLVIIFLAFSATVCLTGVAAVDPGGYFGFYTFPWEFRWRTDLFAWVLCCLFLILFAAMRWAVDRQTLRRQHCRVRPN